MSTHGRIRPAAAIEIAAFAAVSLSAILIASCEGGPASAAPASAPAVDAAAPGDISASPSSALRDGALATTAPPGAMKSSFWDEQLEEAIRTRRAHNAHIEALVRHDGMPEEDIARLMAKKEQWLAEEIAWFHYMKKKYPVE